MSGKQIFGGGSSAPHSLVKTAAGAGRRCVGLTACSAVAVGDWKQFAKLVSSSLLLLLSPSSLLAEARVARLTVTNAAWLQGKFAMVGKVHLFHILGLGVRDS